MRVVGEQALIAGLGGRERRLIAEQDGQGQGFALFFHNFSTFEGKPGIYLEDLYVRPQARGTGLGKAIGVEFARLGASVAIASRSEEHRAAGVRAVEAVGAKGFGIEVDVREPLSEPGDFVVLRALTDLIVAVSACPNDRSPQNGRNPSDLLVRVFAD